MIAPGVLVLGSPLVVGYLFGASALAGLLAGGMVSGVQMAISMANSGGAWDNCKKGLEHCG
jgi:Na+/H+-translocating membrane pyrophosphatase